MEALLCLCSSVLMGESVSTLSARAMRRAPRLQETAGLSDAEVDRAVVAAEGDLDAAVAALHERQHPPAPAAHATNGARLWGAISVACKAKTGAQMASVYDR